jgi:hypothetical protein
MFLFNTFIIFITSFLSFPFVQVPLFVPTFLSSQSSSDLSAGVSTTFVLTGSSLYPCGLTFSVYKDTPSNIVGSGIAVTVADESTAAVVIANSIFGEDTDLSGYYGYLVYGAGWRNQTEAIPLFGGGSKQDSPSQSKVNAAGLVVGIVIAVLAVIAVVIVIVVFMVWRHNEIRKRTTESAMEREGMAGVKYVACLYFIFYIIYFFFFFFFLQ